jgi:hypothetical protein
MRTIPQQQALRIEVGLSRKLVPFYISFTAQYKMGQAFYFGCNYFNKQQPKNLSGTGAPVVIACW